MPTLNPGILEEVLLQLHRHSNFGEEVDVRIEVDLLKKFMESGLEPFNVALRHFSRATRALVLKSRLLVQVKHGARIYEHFIPYQFEFLDAILTVLPKTLTLTVFHNPESASGRRVFAIFIAFKKFARIHFHHNCLPVAYADLFKTEYGLEKVELYHDYNNSRPSIEDFFEMVANHHSVCSNDGLQYFIQEIREMRLHQSFSKVKNLTLSFNARTDDFVLNVNNIRRFFFVFHDFFPQLESLNCDIYGDCTRQFDAMFAKMLKMQPQEFNGIISPEIKGSINFQIYSFMDGPEEDFSEIQGIPYMKKIDSIDGELRREGIAKEFGIHDGFTFKFVVEWG